MSFELLEDELHSNLIRDAAILSRRDKEDVTRRIFCFKGDVTSLINAELKRIENETGGVFTHCLQNGIESTNDRFGTVVKYRHICERYGKPKGRNAVIQTKDAGKLARVTRANGCRAYVSHLIARKGDVRVCVQRLYNEHNGHDPNNPEDNCKSKLSPELLERINEWLSLGYKPHHIYSRCVSWAKSQGYLDQRNRRYYPSKKDLDNLAQMYRRKVRTTVANSDGDLTSLLFDSVYKENVIYFQDGDESYSIPMLLVVQSKWQFEQFKKYGNGVVILNATFNGLSSYGYSLYTLLVRNDRNKPVPVAFGFMSDENEDLIYEFLFKLGAESTKNGYSWHPRAVMVDTDWKEIHALNRLFGEETPILLCWFRMLQVVLRWTVKDDSGLRFDREGRHTVIKYLSMLKDCSTEEEFEALWNELIPKLPRKVAVYLTDTWKPIAHMWANYGRLLFRKFAEANLAIEQLFCTVKWQFFKQYINRPIEDLLQVLMVDILSRSTNICMLVEPGKLPKSELAKQAEEMEKAKAMLARGDANRIIWHSENNTQTVPSETLADVSYIVNVSETWCSCQQHNHRSFKCKHLCLVELCSLAQGTDLDRIRESIATGIYYSGNYQRLDNIFTVVNSGTGFVNCVDLTSDKCICPTASFGVECICRKVVRMFNESEMAGGIGVYPISICSPPGNSVYQEGLDDPSTVEIVAAEIEVDGDVAWTPEEMVEVEQNDLSSSSIEMARFNSAPNDALTASAETKLLCENIIAKLNSGWTPPTTLLNSLRKFSYNDGGNLLPHVSKS